MTTIPFQTTPEQLEQAYRLAARMALSGLSVTFIHQILTLAKTDQGVFDLMELWSHAPTQEDMDAILLDLQSAINDYRIP